MTHIKYKWFLSKNTIQFKQIFNLNLIQNIISFFNYIYDCVKIVIISILIKQDFFNIYPFFVSFKWART